MNDNLDNLIDFYTNKKKQGLDFSQIRNELTIKNYDPETIKTIIKGIDNRILTEELLKSNKIRNSEIKTIGLILLIGGIIMTILSYISIINMRGYFILAYGPILAGFFMLLVSSKNRLGKDKISKRKRYFE